MQRVKKRKRFVFLLGACITWMVLSGTMSTKEDVQEQIGNGLVEEPQKETEETVEPKQGGITVYSDVDGRYFYYENGVEKTVYCYHQNRKQPSMSGTDGYRKVSFFSPEAESPKYPTTKEIIATGLYLGYPSNATGLMEYWGLPSYRANYLTQLLIWSMVDGDLPIWVPPGVSYESDLNYYAANKNSPYFGEYGAQGTLQLSKTEVELMQDESGYYSDVIEIQGTYSKSFWFDSLPKKVKVYDAVKHTEVKGNLKPNMKIYFRYTGTGTPGTKIQLPFSYETTDYFYLLASENHADYQDMIGADYNWNTQTISLKFPKEKKITHSVQKVWEDDHNQMGMRPEKIQVQLKANNENYGPLVELSERNQWRYTWHDLPEKSSGNQIQYQVVEVTPHGYEPIYTTKDGSTQITNQLVKQELKILKKNAANGNVLQHATFRIQALSEPGMPVYDVSATTNEHGEALWSLPIGTYEITEIQAPDGFIKLEQSIPIVVTKEGIHSDQITVTKEGNRYVIEIMNKAIEQIYFPETGGTGTMPYYGTGIIMVMVATKFYKGKKREGKRD